MVVWKCCSGKGGFTGWRGPSTVTTGYSFSWVSSSDVRWRGIIRLSYSMQIRSSSPFFHKIYLVSLIFLGANSTVML